MPPNDTHAATPRQGQESPICFRLPAELVTIIDNMRDDTGSWGQYKSRTGALIALAMLGAGREWLQVKELIDNHCRKHTEGN